MGPLISKNCKLGFIILWRSYSFVTSWRCVKPRITDVQLMCDTLMASVPPTAFVSVVAVFVRVRDPEALGHAECSETYSVNFLISPVFVLCALGNVACIFTLI